MGNEKKGKLSFKNIGIDKLIIMLLAGVFILIVSNTVLNQETAPKADTPVVNQGAEDISGQQDAYVERLENKLKKILEKVDGVGQVEVMITLKASSEMVVNKDKPYSNSTTQEEDAEGGSRISEESRYEEETVLSNSAAGSNAPFVIKELEPEILGVVIIAEGGGNVLVKSELTKAAEVLFNIPVHKIVVMKMDTD